MRLSTALAPFLPDTGAVIALVGGGGKTSALFRLGQELAARGRSGALLTTTTQIRDPRLEDGRDFDQLVLDRDGRQAWPPAPATEDRGPLLVLAAQAVQGKLQGVTPDRIAGLAEHWRYLLIEADGSRNLPVKAPAPYEPVLPARVDLLLGVIGLECLGRPMDGHTVHRPERFAAVSGCAPGEPIRLAHLAALCQSPQGLFQGAPAAARRVLLLNKADLCPLEPGQLLGQLGRLGLDRIAIASLGNSDPEEAVLAHDGMGSKCV